MICTLGDLLLDVVVRLNGPVIEDTDTYGRTRVAPGGQAANVAAWVTALGGAARFVGKRARDPAGRILAAALAAQGVEVAGPEVERGTGTVVSLADAAGPRTMLTDRGVSPDLRADELDPSWLRCEVLHLSAYSLVRPPVGEAAVAAARLARDAGARVTIDLSGTSAIRELGARRFRSLLGELAPGIVFGNEEEVDLVGEVEAPLVIVKRGSLGCSLRHPDGRSEDVAAVPTDVVDTTGAGDAFAAGFLVGGVDLALDAAARCVASVGAFPE